MSQPVEISICTPQDCNRILEELPEFWDGRDTRHLHHPFLIHEFRNSAFVIRPCDAAQKRDVEDYYADQSRPNETECGLLVAEHSRS